MIRPKDLKDEDVWAMLRACRDGDLDLVKTQVARRPDLISCGYNYTPPIHFAVREGHPDLVSFLLEHGAETSSYRTYPFQDSLLTMAEDREHSEIVDPLTRHRRNWPERWFHSASICFCRHFLHVLAVRALSPRSDTFVCYSVRIFLAGLFATILGFTAAVQLPEHIVTQVPGTCWWRIPT